MKISDKILWFAVGSLFGGVLAFLIFLGVSTTPLIDRAQPLTPSKGSTKLVTQSFPLKYFSKIKASGNWDLDLKNGDIYEIKIEAPEYLLANISLEKDGELLDLRLRKGWRTKKDKLKASITFPTIKSLRVSGAVNVHLKGFNSERLKIKASGSTNINGDSNKIYYMSVKGSGAFQLNLKDNPVTFAEVDLSGASLVELTMAGGDLKGEISGSGKVVYDGEIRNQEVRISGSGQVERRK